MLMDEHLARMAAEFGDRTAFEVVDVGSMTFAEWDGMANAMARGLVEAGLSPGDRVGIHLHPESALRWLVSYTAAHRAGGLSPAWNLSRVWRIAWATSRRTSLSLRNRTSRLAGWILTSTAAGSISRNRQHTG